MVGYGNGYPEGIVIMGEYIGQSYGSGSDQNPNHLILLSSFIDTERERERSLRLSHACLQ